MRRGRWLSRKFFTKACLSSFDKESLNMIVQALFVYRCLSAHCEKLPGRHGLKGDYYGSEGNYYGSEGMVLASDL